MIRTTKLGFYLFTVLSFAWSKKSLGQHAGLPHALLYKFAITDYNDLDSRYSSRSDRSFHPADLNYAADLGYRRHLKGGWGAGINLRIGSVDSYVNDSLRLKNQFMLNADALAIYHFNDGKILPEKGLLAPYALLGLGWTWRYYDLGWGSDAFKPIHRQDIQLPIGLGLDLRLAPQFYLQGQAEMRTSLRKGDHNLALSIGFVWLPKLDRHDPEPLPPAMEQEDSDGDGVNNLQDLCPQIAGPAHYQGCPDDDKDGLPDHQDLCPQAKGSLSLQGCPDDDNDGLSNLIDFCPQTAGPSYHAGCPTENLPQTCQTLLQAQTLSEVQFETASANPLPKTLLALDKLADLLQKESNLQLKIYAHTDNAGGTSANLTLSQNRAKACYNYLLSKNIDASRLQCQGFGESKPKANNQTAEGRMQNHRVEFIFNKS